MDKIFAANNFHQFVTNLILIYNLSSNVNDGLVLLGNTIPDVGGVGVWPMYIQEANEVLSGKLDTSLSTSKNINMFPARIIVSWPNPNDG